MKKNKKGFSLIETLTALFIFAGLISVFGLLMTKGIKMNRNSEKNHDVLNDGLIISERIYKNMKYTSANLVNVFPADSNNNNECLAIGFPIISEVKSSNIIEIDKTGYNIDSYDCTNINNKNLLKKNWQGYVIYLYDKNGEYFEKDKKNCFYEIKFKYDTNENNRTILTRKKNSDWATALNLDCDYSKPQDFYKKALKQILSSKQGNNQKMITKNLISKNIKSFKISTNSYPVFKMRVLLDYGVYGGNNPNGRNSIGNKAENFEMNWIVLPVN